ncbi:MAG: hypothetical protein AAB467_00710 [Patescibacteria group bacterium]
MSEKVIGGGAPGEGVPKRPKEESISEMAESAAAWAMENDNVIRIVEYAVRLLANKGMDITADYLSEHEIDLLDILDEERGFHNYLWTRKGAEKYMNELLGAMVKAHEIIVKRENELHDQDLKKAAGSANRSVAKEEAAPEDVPREGVPKRSNKESISEAETNATAWAKENENAASLIDSAIIILPGMNVEFLAEYLSNEEPDLLVLWEKDDRLVDYLRTRKGAQGRMNDLRSAMELAHAKKEKKREHFSEKDAETIVGLAIGRRPKVEVEYVPVLNTSKLFGQSALSIAEGKLVNISDGNKPPKMENKRAQGQETAVKNKGNKVGAEKKEEVPVNPPKESAPTLDRTEQIEKFLKIATEQKLMNLKNFFGAIVRYSNDKLSKGEKHFSKNEIREFREKLYAGEKRHDISNFVSDFFKKNPSIDLIDFGNNYLMQARQDAAPARKAGEENKPSEVAAESEPTWDRREQVEQFLEFVKKEKALEPKIFLKAIVKYSNDKKLFSNAVVSKFLKKLEFAGKSPHGIGNFVSDFFEGNPSIDLIDFANNYLMKVTAEVASTQRASGGNKPVEKKQPIVPITEQKKTKKMNLGED